MPAACAGLKRTDQEPSGNNSRNGVEDGSVPLQPLPNHTRFDTRQPLQKNLPTLVSNQSFHNFPADAAIPTKSWGIGSHHQTSNRSRPLSKLRVGPWNPDTGLAVVFYPPRRATSHTTLQPASGPHLLPRSARQVFIHSNLDGRSCSSAPLVSAPESNRDQEAGPIDQSESCVFFPQQLPR